MRLQAQHLLNERSGLSESGDNRFRDLKQAHFFPEVHSGQDILAPEAFEKHYAEILKSADDGRIHIAVLRVNNLRTIEAEHGEKVASLLLRVIGRNILKKIRGTDLLTCYGDVFAIILSDTMEDGVRFAMHRVLEQFRDNRYSVGNNKTVELNLSAGVAVSIPHLRVSLEGSMNIALQALENAGDYEIVSYVIEQEGVTPDCS
jgi:diguanylate cyclase (GGDEF)-like protein